VTFVDASAIVEASATAAKTLFPFVAYAAKVTMVPGRRLYMGEALRSSPLDQNPQTASLSGRAQKGWGKEMTGKHVVESWEGSRRQLQGLPVIRRNVAGLDLGTERHWVCAPSVEQLGDQLAPMLEST
jgi:hypothetical protein